METSTEQVNDGSGIIPAFVLLFFLVMVTKPEMRIYASVTVFFSLDDISYCTVSRGFVIIITIYCLVECILQ